MPFRIAFLMRMLSLEIVDYDDRFALPHRFAPDAGLVQFV